MTQATLPQRIVSCLIASDEVLLRICDPARILALSALAEDPAYSNIVEEARRVPGRAEQSAEQIIGLEPDLVFVASFSRPEYLALLSEANIRVMTLENFNSFDDIRENIRAIGATIGEEEKANALIQEMNRRIEDVRATVADTPKPRVLKIGYDWVAGGGTTIHDIIEAAGGRNLAAANGIEGHRNISEEQILDWDPEVILTEWPEAGPIAQEMFLQKYPILEQVRAVQSGRVFGLPGRELNSVTHHVASAVERLARLLHPERFNR